MGDRLTVKASASGNKPLSTVTKIINERSFLIKGQGALDASETFTVSRSLLKAESNDFPGSAVYSANVQNVYKEKYKDDIIVASSSLPFYNGNSLNADSRAVVFSGTFIGDEFEIILTGDHGFYTGDAIYYTPEKLSNHLQIDKQVLLHHNSFRNITFGGNTGGEGLYFVKRITARTIKLSKSRTDIYNNKFVTLESSTPVTNNKFDLYDFRQRTLETQKLYRKFSTPIDDGTVTLTNPGFTGLLLNGVEVLNYKSKDVIKYGEVRRIDVLNGGDDYDVINPPVLHVEDSVGTGVTGTVSVSGSLQEIRIIDPGFDYEEVPRLELLEEMVKELKQLHLLKK